jgi:hypothetical protein
MGFKNKQKEFKSEIEEQLKENYPNIYASPFWIYPYILIDIASKTSHEADIEGITGFMYGTAVKVLTDCWKHGEDLRKWHNGEYGHTGEGVVNPAVMTISV